MELSGERRLPAAKQTVWDALNDPDVLRDAIPGCDDLSKLSDTSFEATVTSKIGPVKAKFKGEVTLSDIDAPNSYTITGEGKGASGFAKGGAKVRLEEDGDGTLLIYEVDANVGGKLAQLGSRLIDGVARKLADEFFDTFAEQVAAQAPAAAAEAAAPEEAAEPIDVGKPAAATEVPPAVVDEAGKAGDASPEMLHVRPDQSEHRGQPPHEEVAPERRGLPNWVWVVAVLVLIGIILSLYGD
jgi:carbon monoxide dehydrogenase subunit G